MAKTNGNLKVTVPTFIPLAEAVHKYNLTEEVLTRLIRDGRIDGALLPSGELFVSDDGLNEAKTKEQIIEEKFGHLRGKTVSARAASQKYGISHKTFIRWARAGYIRILREEDRLLELDAADVAYCAFVHATKKQEYGGTVSGVRIFDEEGNPYRVKYPELSVKRRQSSS
jgi:hypothetical protein